MKKRKRIMCSVIIFYFLSPVYGFNLISFIASTTVNSSEYVLPSNANVVADYHFLINTNEQVDASGNGNTITLGSGDGMPTYVAKDGDVDAHYDYTTDDYGTAANESNFDSTNFTIVAFCNLDSKASATTILAKWYDAPTRKSWRFGFTAGAGAIRLSTSPDGQAQDILDGSVVGTGDWHMISITFDDKNNERNLYLDGTLDANSTADIVLFSSGEPVEVGRLNNLSGWEFEGPIARTIIWDVILDSNALVDVWTNVKGNYGL